MNATFIELHARTIGERQLALKWLNEFGASLSGRSDDTNATASVRLNFRAACAGAKEAEQVLSSYARVFLPEIVKAAVECCRNDIVMSRDAIRKEVESVE